MRGNVAELWGRRIGGHGVPVQTHTVACRAGDGPARQPDGVPSHPDEAAAGESSRPRSRRREEEGVRAVAARGKRVAKVRLDGWETELGDESRGGGVAGAGLTWV